MPSSSAVLLTGTTRWSPKYREAASLSAAECGSSLGSTWVLGRKWISCSSPTTCPRQRIARHTMLARAAPNERFRPLSEPLVDSVSVSAADMTDASDRLGSTTAAKYSPGLTQSWAIPDGDGWNRTGLARARVGSCRPESFSGSDGAGRGPSRYPPPYLFDTRWSHSALSLQSELVSEDSREDTLLSESVSPIDMCVIAPSSDRRLMASTKP